MDIDELTIPFKIIEIVYYATVWIVACIAGIARAMRSNDLFSCRNFISIGFCSGFLGVAVVTLRDWTSGGFTGTEWGGIGIAALVGLAGKEQEVIIKVIWRSILKQFGVKADEFNEVKNSPKNVIPVVDHNPDRGNDGQCRRNDL